MKRTISIVLVVMLLLPAYTAAANTGGQTAFLDISGHWAKDYIMSLFSEGLVSLSPDGNFRPQDPIKVSEFIKLVVVSLGYDIELPQSGNWYDNYIEAAKNMGLIKKLPFQRDYDIREYDANITRAQMAAVITRALKQDSKAMILHGDGYSYPDLQGFQPIEYNGYVRVVRDMEIMTGYSDNTFRPDNTATRAEASKVIYCLIEKLKEDKSHSGDYETFEVNGIRVEAEFPGILPAVKKSLEIIEELDYGYKVIRYNRESGSIHVEVFNSEKEYIENQEAYYDYSLGPQAIVSYIVSLDTDVLGTWEPYTLTLGDPGLPIAVETFEQIVTALLPQQKDYIMQQANKKAKNSKYSVRENRDIEDMNVEAFTRDTSEYIVFYVTKLDKSS